MPLVFGIHRDKLLQFVYADQIAASDAGRLYVDGGFTSMRRTDIVMNLMIRKDKILIDKEHVFDEEVGTTAPMIYRTEYADEWAGLVPVAVQAVVDFLPTNNLLDLLLTALNDEDDEEDLDGPSEP